MTMNFPIWHFQWSNFWSKHTHQCWNIHCACKIWHCV